MFSIIFNVYTFWNISILNTLVVVSMQSKFSSVNGVQERLLFIIFTSHGFKKILCRDYDFNSISTIYKTKTKIPNVIKSNNKVVEIKYHFHSCYCTPSILMEMKKCSSCEGKNAITFSNKNHVQKENKANIKPKKKSFAHTSTTYTSTCKLKDINKEKRQKFRI